MDTSSAISTLESAIGAPRQGLPEDIFLFVSRIAPMVNVDLLIQDHGGRTLLTWRDDQYFYFGRGWHVPGGVIRYKEMAADRSRACALLELGAEVTFDEYPLLVSETILEQASRGHLVSLLYRCRLLTPLDQSRLASPGEARAGGWSWHASCPRDLLPVQSQYRRFF